MALRPIYGSGDNYGVILGYEEIPEEVKSIPTKITVPEQPVWTGMSDNYQGSEDIVKKMTINGVPVQGFYDGSGNLTGYAADVNDTRIWYSPEGEVREAQSLKGNFFKDIATELGPMAITALTMGGGGAFLGSVLAPTASTAVQTAIGNALIQGVGAEATGGDFFKGAATGAISSLAPPAISEAVGGGRLGEAIGKGLTSAATASILGGDATQAGIIGAMTGAAGYKPPAEGLNSPITMAQIESGLGTEGYGYGAQAASSGLFDPAVIGSGAYTQTSYPIDMAELASADAMQLIGQDIGIPAAEQNLVASGLDPLIAADLTQQISLNPNLTSMDLANNLISTYGSNIYDTTIDQINEDAPKSTQAVPTTTPSNIPWDKVAKLLGGFIVTDAGIKSDAPSGFQIVPVPADWKSPEYNMAFTPSAPIDFGTRELLRGTQFENPQITAPNAYNLSNLINTLNMGSVPFVQQNYEFNPAPLEVPDILQQFNVAPTVGMTDIIGNLNNQPVSISDIIAGIQSGQNYSI